MRGGGRVLLNSPGEERCLHLEKWPSGELSRPLCLASLCLREELTLGIEAGP